MWGSIPGPWDHALSWRPPLNDWATQAPLFIYFREKKRERERPCVHRWGEGQRERKRISSGLPTEHGARCWEILTWAKIKSWTLNWLSHPGAPNNTLYTTNGPKKKSQRKLENNKRLNENNMTYPNLLDTVKVVLRVKLRAVNAYIKNQERSWGA